MFRYIDILPPKPTGNAQKDNEALYEYLFYLREQFNSLVTKLNKGEKENGNK